MIWCNSPLLLTDRKKNHSLEICNMLSLNHPIQVYFSQNNSFKHELKFK